MYYPGKIATYDYLETKTNLYYESTFDSSDKRF